jgi:hypothetical protein
MGWLVQGAYFLDWYARQVQWFGLTDIPGWMRF